MNIKQHIKNAMSKTPLLKPLVYVKTVVTTGKLPIKPPTQDEKKSVILQYAKEYSLPVLVETGTHLGDMVENCKNSFEEIYSIELSNDFYNKAKVRFAGDTNVHLYEGDSGSVIREVLPLLSKPVLFWLDAHYSGESTARGESDTPIVKELDYILRNCKQPFCILIDDARLFVGKHDYPRISYLKNIIDSTYPNLAIAVSGDIIRIYPKAV
jgi:hypothetical protein